MRLVGAFIKNIRVYLLSASKRLIPHKFYIIKIIALPRFKNPELSYQTHASAIEIFTFSEINTSS